MCRGEFTLPKSHTGVVIIEPKISQPECQIKYLDHMSEPMNRIEAAWQLRHKLKRVLKRRLTYVRNRLNRATRVTYSSGDSGGNVTGQSLVAGQTVRVRSRAEIQATLDNWNHLRGCAFMEEMWPYCGTSQRVLKPVRRFVDERDHRLKKARGIVFLEGVHCQGTIDYGRCDRNCNYFWREEWLEKVE